MRHVLASVVAVAASALVFAGVGAAAAPQPQPFNCVGLGDIMIVTAPSSDNANDFGAARIVGGGILIPVSFEFSAFDNTTNTLLFADGATKGGGNGNRNQTTTTCSFAQTATLADLLGPGETAPPGTSPTDSVTFTISATVIVKK